MLTNTTKMPHSKQVIQYCYEPRTLIYHHSPLILIMLSAQNIQDLTLLITQVVSPTSYQLQFPSHVTLHPMVHASHLHPYHDSNQFPEHPSPRVLTDFLPLSRDWEIDLVSGSRVHNGGPEFLVHWKGHDISDNMWVPARNLENAHQLILDYNR